MTAPIQLLQITDLHIAVPPRCYAGDQISTDESLAWVLTQLREQPRDFLLCTGDLVNQPSQKSYQRLGEVLSVLPDPVYCLPGNHDSLPLAQHATQAFPLIRWDTCLIRDQWLILMLDSHRENEVPGYLSDTQLGLLRKQLELHPDKHVLICLHHHPIPIGSTWLDLQIVQNREALLQIVAQSPQVRGVLWGHIHQAFHQQYGGIEWIGSPSTCFQFKPREPDYAIDTLPPAYRRLTLHPNGKIETEVIYCELPAH